MDFLDRMNGTGFQTYKGAYYPEMPTLSGIDQTRIDFENPVPFQYEPIDTTRNFGYPVPNIRDTQAEETGIKTKSSMFYGKELGGLVKLQDGQFYEVISCTIDRKSISRQSAEYVKKPVGADYIVRLNKIDNPFIERGFEQSETYSDPIAYNYIAYTINCTHEQHLPHVVVKGRDNFVYFNKSAENTWGGATATNADVSFTESGNRLIVNLTNPTGDVVVTAQSYIMVDTWLINTTPNVSTDIDFSDRFISNGMTYEQFTIEDGKIYFEDTLVYSNGWINQNYRTIKTPTITTAFENWLEANATKL